MKAKSRPAYGRNSMRSATARITRAFAVAEFIGGKGKTCMILAPGANLTRVLAVGIGKPADLTQKILEEAGGAIAAISHRKRLSLSASIRLSPQQAAEVALGAVLRSYRFDRYRTKEKPEDKPKLSKLTILAAEPAKAKSAWEPLDATAKGVFLTRDLVSEPPNVLDPPEMAERCRKLSELGLKVEIFGPKEMAKLGFGALLGVSQGSVKEPRMVVMQWNGAGGNGRKLKDKPVVFVGKGVTFDTGGISIKPAGGMEDMKWDMAGAGTVIGLMAALAGRKAKVDAVGLVGLVENMPSGNAQRPGDVVTSYSGQTIEVINTDAEGRLVLADVIWYAQQKYDPKFMVDLATLTGAIIIGLGHEYAGLFSNDDELSQKLADRGSGDRGTRVADAVGRGLRQADPLRHRRHEERRRPAWRLDHRRPVHPALRQRQTLGASGYCRHGVEHEGHRRRPQRSDRFWGTAARSPGRGSLRALMTEIGFYHLTRSTLVQALPQLLARTLAAGQRALVLVRDAADLDALSTALWADPAWLPHGTVSDGDPDLQPIWLSTEAEPLNGARFLFLVDGANTDRLESTRASSICSMATIPKPLRPRGSDGRRPRTSGSRLGLLATDRNRVAKADLKGESRSDGSLSLLPRRLRV